MSQQYVVQRGFAMLPMPGKGAEQGHPPSAPDPKTGNLPRRVAVKSCPTDLAAPDESMIKRWVEVLRFPISPHRILRADRLTGRVHDRSRGDLDLIAASDRKMVRRRRELEVLREISMRATESRHSIIGPSFPTDTRLPDSAGLASGAKPPSPSPYEQAIATSTAPDRDGDAEARRKARRRAVRRIIIRAQVVRMSRWSRAGLTDGCQLISGTLSEAPSRSPMLSRHRLLPKLSRKADGLRRRVAPILQIKSLGKMASGFIDKVQHRDGSAA